MKSKDMVREVKNGKRTHSTASLAVCVAGLVLLAAPHATPTIAQSASPSAIPPAARELTDEIGRTVRVPHDVKRIVSLAPNLTEIVFALGRGAWLAGDTEYCDYPPEAEQKPHVGGPVNPNLEQVAALKPDIVLASKSINRRETVEALDRIGVPVYVTDPHSIEEMIGSVEHIGAAIGADKSAMQLAQDLRDRMSELERRVGGATPRRVLFIVWTDPLISIGRDTFIADAIHRAGGRSIVETGGEWPHISLEEIVHLQPDVLVFASAHGAETHREIDELRSRPGWRDLAAMQQDSVVVISDAINRPAPRMIDAIERLARALHPETFASGSANEAGQALRAAAEQRAVACAL